MNGKERDLKTVERQKEQNLEQTWIEENQEKIGKAGSSKGVIRKE